MTGSVSALLNNVISWPIKVTTYVSDFVPLHPQISRKKKVRMKIRFYHIAIRYQNKIHDFHAWGVAALI